jgi:ParB family chromosome partitioning protein
MKMEFKIVDVDELVPNPFQPREGFDKESISELANSLKSVGEIQPIIVRKTQKGYQIIAGERRWRAAKFAKLKEIPVLVKDTAEENVLLESLIENLHRLDLTSVERENAIYELWKSGRWKSYGELAKVLGKTEEWIKHNIEAASLRKKEKISPEISTSTIAEVAPLEREERKLIIEKIQREEIPIRKVREVAKILKKAPPPIKRAILKPKARITPTVAEKIMELPEEKQVEAIKQIEELRLEEEEAIPHVERFKVEVPLPPPERIEEVRKRYEELQREIKARLEAPEVKERGVLARNWLGHVTISGALNSIRCPICGRDWRSLVWKCHDLDIKEALKMAEQKYQESIKRKQK